MKRILKHIRESLHRLYRDEQGSEAFEKILILAAFIIPLLLLLYFYGEDLRLWLETQWAKLK